MTSTFLQDLITTLSLGFGFPICMAISAACAIVDGIEYAAFQGEVIEHGPENQRPAEEPYQPIGEPEEVSCWKTLLSKLLQTSSLLVSLVNVGSDRFFMLSSWVSLFNTLELTKIEDLETNCYFLGLFSIIALTALVGRAGTDNYEVNKAIAQTIEKQGAKPVQAAFFKLIGQRSGNMRALVRELTSKESAFYDLSSTALLSSLLLNILRRRGGCGLDIEREIVLSVAAGFASAGLYPYLYASEFDKTTIRNNIRLSADLEAREQELREVSAREYSWTKVFLSICSVFSGLNLAAPATLALISVIQYLQSDDASDETKALGLPLVITVALFFTVVFGLGALSNQYSEANAVMSYMRVRPPRVEEVPVVDDDNDTEDDPEQGLIEEHEDAESEADQDEEVDQDERHQQADDDDDCASHGSRIGLASMRIQT